MVWELCKQNCLNSHNCSSTKSICTLAISLKLTIMRGSPFTLNPLVKIQHNQYDERDALITVTDVRAHCLQFIIQKIETALNLHTLTRSFRNQYWLLYAWWASFMLSIAQLIHTLLPNIKFMSGKKGDLFHPRVGLMSDAQQVVIIHTNFHCSQVVSLFRVWLKLA